MIYDVISSLVVLIEKLAFFNKQLEGFIISLNQKSLEIQFEPFLTYGFSKKVNAFSREMAKRCFLSLLKWS